MSTMKKSMSVAARVCVLAALSGGAWGQCGPGWSEAFTPAFMRRGDDASATVFDDGAGPKLVVSDLMRKGDRQGGLQMWDGAAWTTVTDSGFDLGSVGIVRADDNPAVPRLFATLETPGLFDVLLFEGGLWRSTGFPAEPGLSLATCILPDPGSDDVYVGGLFDQDGQWTKVYRWDGSTWTALDSDRSGASVSDLAWFNDGSGPALYAGVRNQIDGVPVAGVARWDGVSWSEVGGGCPASWPALAVHDDGAGEALWALDGGGGSLARWDGESWIEFPLQARNAEFSWRLESVELAGSRRLVWLDRSLESAEVWQWDGVDGEP
ncbi:MAG TPA: hypothetical protein VFF69_04155, partial [Phycisphaerales bacterium]|nr:hypothetical protein [Phycisphaerales bacterium]